MTVLYIYSVKMRDVIKTFNITQCTLSGEQATENTSLFFL